MPKSQNPFEIDFDSYILQSEPSMQEKGKLWQTAIGLQQVDGLTPSKYLYETAKRNIDGESVFYANADMIYQTLDYDFSQEKTFDYSKLTMQEKIKHLARFIANIWQIHPFGEGNTRTTAVFTIKYLNSLGFKVNNEPFEKHSWYFRNALVRANYTNMTKGIYMNTKYLEKFFRNLLLNEKNELKNRYVDIRYNENPAIESQQSGDKVAIYAKSSDIILKHLKEHETINSSIARKITGLSASGVRKIFKKLEASGLIIGFGENKGKIYKIKK